MGNSPSSPSSQDQRPLSKPATDAWNSDSLSPTARNEEHSVSTTLKEPFDAVKQSSSSTSSLTQEERNKLHSDILGFGGEFTYQEKGEIYREGDDHAELGNTVKDHLSRTESLISQASSRQMLSTMNTTAAATMSLVTEPGAELDLTAVIHILQELKKTASPEDLVALHKALLPTRKQEPAPESPMKAVPAPEIARAASTRRSGLHIPGFATRGSADLLRKPRPVRGVQSSEQKSPSWKQELPDLPSARLATIDNERNGRKISGPRSMTPGDLDYARIGQKLGTLRVINGAATPERCATPTQAAPARLVVPDTLVEDGYYTASEGRVSPEEVFHQQPSRTESADRHSHKLSLNTQQPIAQSHSHHEPESAAAEALTGPQRRLSHSDSDKIYLSGPDYVVKNQTMPDVTSSMALDYMAELSSSPYTRANSPSLTTISSPEESSRSAYLIAGSSTPKPPPPMAEPLLTMPMLKLAPSHGDSWGGLMNDSRGERILGAQLNVPRNAHLRGQSQASSMYVDEARSNGTDKRASLVQTDSGYVSETSVKLAKERQLQDDYEPTLASLELLKKQKGAYNTKPLPEIADLEETRSLYTLEEMLRKTGPPLSATKQITHEDQSHTLKKSASRFQRLRAKSFRKDSRKSAPPSPLAESSHNISFTVVTDKSAKFDAATGPRKLQKQRPLSQVVLAASIGSYETKDAGQDVIPDIPNDMTQKFLNRPASIPSAEFLKPSFETRTPTSSQVDLPLSDENPNVTSKPQASELVKPDVAQRSWFPRTASASKPPNPALHHPNGSKTHVKPPSPDSEDGITPAEVQLMNGIADFGTVAHQLGGSPYDIAMSTTRPKSTPVAQHQILHPFQMGAFFPRPKIMMNEEMAAEFARRKSHDLQNTRLTRSFTRSRSYHDQEFDNQRDTSGRNNRPHSIYTDVPPVPALPTSQAAQKHSPAPSDTQKTRSLAVLGREESCPLETMAGTLNKPRHVGNPPFEPPERRFELDGGSCHQPSVLDAGVVQHLQAGRSVNGAVKHQLSQSAPSTSQRDFGVTASNPPPPPPKVGPEEKAASHREFQRRSFVEQTPQNSPMHRQWPPEQFEQQSLPPPRLPSAPPSILVSQGPACHVVEEPRKIENTKPVQVGSQDIDWEAEAALWRKRRQSVGQGLLQENAAQKRGSGNDSPAKVTPAPSPIPSLKLSDTSVSQGSIASTRRPELSRSKSSGEAIFDRYSGGFEYDYEHGFGFGGSAGTRSVWSEASRKSTHYSVQHGLDLSDVPVFLQKA